MRWILSSRTARKRLFLGLRKSPSVPGLAVGIAPFYRDPVADKVIELAVVLQERA